MDENERNDVITEEELNRLFGVVEDGVQSSYEQGLKDGSKATMEGVLIGGVLSIAGIALYEFYKKKKLRQGIK